MAGTVTIPRTLAALAALAMAGPSAAQVPDPTRPPAALSAAAPAVPGTAAATAPRAASAPVPVVWRLQSVQLPHEGAPSALVNGRLVGVGDRLGERQVVSIDAGGVQLRGSRGQVERLSLLDPAIEQHAVVPERSATVERLAKGQPR